MAAWESSTRRRQVKANRLVALKMILHGGHASREDLQRFRTEAVAIARLQHPNIVAIYDVDEHEGTPFYTMELCAGGSLHRELAGTPLEAGKAAALVQVLAQAIHCAHQANVIHRDLKPANILLSFSRDAEISELSARHGTDGTNGPHMSHPSHLSHLPGPACPLHDFVPKITDFGLAKKLDDVGQTASAPSWGRRRTWLPSRPAASRTRSVQPRTCTRWGPSSTKCLTGRPPFKAATPLDTILQVSNDPPVPPSQLQSKTPRNLETICLKCLSKEPHKRYATALELAEDLARFQAGFPILARPIGKLERGWRWCRRNPAVAAASAAAALLLVTVAVVSVVFAVEQEQGSRRVQAEKGRTEAALTSSRRNEALLTCDRATRICEEGEDGQSPDPSRGLLWLTRAIELAPVDDEKLQYLLRTNWAAWQTRVCPLRGTLSVSTPSAGHFATWSPTGRQVLVGSRAGLEIWDVSPWRQARTLPLEGKTLAVAWSPDGRQVASGGPVADPIRIWCLENGTVRTLKAPGRVYDLNFSADSKLLAAACSNGEVTFWNADTAEIEGKPLPLGEQATSVSFHPDGRRLVTSTSSTLQQWDFAKRAAIGKPIRRSGKGPNGFRCARYSATGKLFYAVTFPSQGVFVHATETGQQVGRFFCSYGLDVHLSPDDKHFVIGMDASRADVCDMASGSVLSTIPGHRDKVTAVSYAPDGRTILTASGPTLGKFSTASRNGTVRLSALPEDSSLAPFTLAFKGPGLTYSFWDVQNVGIRCLAVNPNSKWLFAGGWDKDGWLLNLADGSVRGKITGHEHVITAAAFTQDGKRLLTGSADGSVRLWDANTCRLLQGPWRLPNAVRSLAFSPNDSLAAVASLDTGHLLAPGSSKRGEGGELSGALWGPSHSAVFLPNGKGVLVGRVKGAELWDVEQRKNVDTSLSHTSRVWAVAVDVSGERAATGAYQVGQIWDLRSGIPIGPPLRHRDFFLGLAFSPDRRIVASIGKDREARFWDAATGRPIGPALKHPGPGNALVFRPDGSELLTGSSTPQIYRWRSASTRHRGGRSTGAAGPGSHRDGTRRRRCGSCTRYGNLAQTLPTA